MKLKKLLIISLSFILTSTFLITPLSASSTVSLGKYDFNNGETPEITMTEAYSKIIFTAYFDDGEKIYSYVDKNTGNVDRNVYSLDDVNIKVVPSSRMKTKYEFSNGCVPAGGAKQINIILIHPSCQVTRSKYAYIKIFTPGHDSRTGDNYLYQNRAYGDTFLIKNKACGIAINAEAED